MELLWYLFNPHFKFGSISTWHKVVTADMCIGRVRGSIRGSISSVAFDGSKPFRLPCRVLGHPVVKVPSAMGLGPVVSATIGNTVFASRLLLLGAWLWHYVTMKVQICANRLSHLSWIGVRVCEQLKWAYWATPLYCELSGYQNLIGYISRTRVVFFTNSKELLQCEQPDWFVARNFWLGYQFIHDSIFGDSVVAILDFRSFEFLVHFKCTSE